ncbi:MAG: hypothetical protein E2P04_07240 [Acidobacteria bacterium]|nr:MAG: hypothetical protein E2P04_07240 [Acidobacteriota bacterium]
MDDWEAKAVLAVATEGMAAARVLASRVAQEGVQRRMEAEAEAVAEEVRTAWGDWVVRAIVMLW